MQAAEQVGARALILPLLGSVCTSWMEEPGYLATLICDKSFPAIFNALLFNELLCAITTCNVRLLHEFKERPLMLSCAAGAGATGARARAGQPGSARNIVRGVPDG